MSKIFEYTSPTIPEGSIKISPSRLAKFYTNPSEWYKEEVLLEEPKFKGNTSSYIGTICHYVYEQVTLNNQIGREEINKELDEYLIKNPNPDIDLVTVKNCYPQVVNKVVNDYVLSHNKLFNNIECEKQVTVNLSDNIILGGTCDRIEGTTLCDYKNVSTKPNENVIPFHYRLQLMAYTYALRELGYVIDNIRIIYGVHPTKTIPARCIVVTESITYEHEQLIQNTLKLVKDTINFTKEHPELAYLIYKDYTLKR